jgi:hypothetical protein
MTKLLETGPSLRLSPAYAARETAKLSSSIWNRVIWPSAIADLLRLHPVVSGLAWHRGALVASAATGNAVLKSSREQARVRGPRRGITPPQ